ncbi:MAG: (d)CMP kinase [Candidatus Hydrogenedentes bacterium]|jgi:cytidylate kinase|nr:(d)CMP kinase [Candidatus Hydrogenedentota bacterium]
MTTSQKQHCGTQIVAVDGPAGAGKSSVSRQTARELGFAFLDTGAMYRAATWLALTQGVPLDDAEALEASTRAMALELREEADCLRVFVSGREITDAIRSEEVTRSIFHLDQIPGVRRHLVSLQREFGCRRPTVAEGRDIGTVVFPQARCKIYLDADPACRAQRRARQLETMGKLVDFSRLLAEIKERDAHNLNRADSPLRKADDAIVVDTTFLSFEAVVAELVRLAQERL